MRPAPARRWSRLAWPVMVVVALAGCSSAGGYGAGPATATAPVTPAATAVAALVPTPAVTASPAPTVAPASSAPAATMAPAAPPASAGSAASSSGGGAANDGYGDGYGGYGGGYGGASPAAAVSPPPSAATPATLATGEVAGVGTVLVGPGGLTLYTYKPDGTGASTCTGGCAQAWPPFVATAVPALPAGATGTVSLVTRPDGSRQVAYDGRPLYEYAGDATAGAATGQGLGGVRFVAKP